MDKYFKDANLVPPHDTYLEKLVALHRLVRERKPGRVLELGVKHGFMKYVILKAQELEGRGELVSVDRSALAMRTKETGHLVPDSLRNRWILKIGEASSILPTIGKFDLVCEDVGAPLDASIIPMLWDCTSENGALFVAARTTKPEYDKFAESHEGWSSKAEGVNNPRAAWGLLLRTPRIHSGN